MVSWCSPNVFNVSGSQTFLAGCCSREVELAFPQEMILELIHAGWRE
jgi:hypothetical protein